MVTATRPPLIPSQIYERVGRMTIFIKSNKIRGYLRRDQSDHRGKVAANFRFDGRQSVFPKDGSGLLPVFSRVSCR